MPYCTVAQLLKLIGAPVTWGTGNTPTEADVEAMILRKSEAIDSKCRDRYEVPFTDPPEVVVDTCIQLVLADLLPIIFFSNPFQIERAGKLGIAARDTLTGIQKGTTSLFAEDEASQGMGGQVDYTAPTTDRLFTIDQDY
jgi:hypothetical protein